LISNELYS